MPKSSYLDTLLLNWVKGTTMAAAPAAVYCSLYNGDPQGAGSEVTTSIRVAGRVAITFGAVASNSINNSALVNFGSSAGAATVTHFGVHDAASAGNLLGSNSLSTGSQVITSGLPVSFAIGALIWSES